MNNSSDGANDKPNIRSVIKRLNLIAFGITITLLAVHMLIPIDTETTYTIMMPLVLSSLSLAIFTAASIMTYGKRDIIRITQPQGNLKGIGRFLSTTFSHSFDLLISPAVILMVFNDIAPYYDYINLNFATLGTIAFIIITLVQTAPLKVRKDIYFRRAKAEIRESINDITLARCMRAGLDRRKREYKHLYQNQIDAETLIRAHMEFLTLSNGIAVFLTSMARFLLPIAGSVFNLFF